jgi:DNA-binding Lrp family transcriptional regulator
MDRRNIKNIRIIKLLIRRPKGEWTRYGLAKASGCSRQWVIYFLRKLEKKGFVSGTGAIDVLGLVKYGASIIPAPLRTVDCYYQNPLKLLKTAGKEYAITTTYAENALSHHLFKTRCDAYVTEAMLKTLWARIVKDGLLGRGNLRLIIPLDEKIISEAAPIRGVRYVSIGQLMLDLVNEGGVGIEALEELVKKYVR